MFNLLDDYGKVMAVQVEAACMLCITTHTSLHAKQNTQMMYECMINSIMEEAKSSLASQDHLIFHEDSPSLFFHIVMQLFTATFSNTQATWDKLSDFHPKWYKYDIVQVNNYICTAVKMLKSATTASGTITDQEILYFQFKIYKNIKSPAEWNITYPISRSFCC